MQRISGGIACLFCILLDRVPFICGTIISDKHKLWRVEGGVDTQHAQQSSNDFLSAVGSRKKSSSGQSVHWIFVTDCSAYQFNQGNLLLSSMVYVKQPGNLTWIVHGCQREEQKAAFKNIAHPQANVFHTSAVLNDPATGQPYRGFQASNRPIAISTWFSATHPQEEAVGILDPDMMWLRPVILSDAAVMLQTQGSGFWQSPEAHPKLGVGAMYGQGCIPRSKWNASQYQTVCGAQTDKCLSASENYDKCRLTYSSGPPWILHQSDAADQFATWGETVVNTHKVWPDMLSEQVSYGVTQMRHSVTNKLDPYWFISRGEITDQPWKPLTKVDYDPCRDRAPPPSDVDLPPLFHSCSTFFIPQYDREYRIHKDHIHKDLLDCQAPLLRYPPTDALDKAGFKVKNETALNTENARLTWMTCAYTNLVNFHATRYKQQFCKDPNLNASFKYPDHAMGFLNKDSWVEKTFRKGGWQDVDYKIM